MDILVAVHPIAALGGRETRLPWLLVPLINAHTIFAVIANLSPPVPLDATTLSLKALAPVKATAEEKVAAEVAAEMAMVSRVAEAVESLQDKKEMAGNPVCLNLLILLPFLNAHRACLTLPPLVPMANRCATSSCTANALNHVLTAVTMALRPRP